MFVLKRLLLLEDNPNDAELNIREVQKCGLKPEIKIVSSEPDFTESLRSFKPDLILADYNLPGYSGMKALEYAHTKHPEIPFIFVTGSLDEETAVECIKKGAWDYVLKTNLIRLKPALENAIKLKSEQLKVTVSSKIIEREELKFRQIVEQLNETILILTPQGIINYISPGVRFAGYRPEEIVGHKFYEFCLPEDLIQIKSEFRKALISEQITTRELKVVRKNGTTFWISAMVKKITDPEGKISILITTNNIDRQKKAYEALNESEKMFRKMTENISDGLIISEQGRIRFFNDRVCQIFGCFPSEISDLDVLDLVEPEERERLKKIFAEEKRTGFGPGELEFWIRRKDGIRRYIHNRYSYTRENGKIISRYIIISDLTEKKLSDETIRIYYNQIHTLVQAIPDLVFIKDESGRYILFNKAYEKFIGLPAEHILHKKDDEILTPDLAKKSALNDRETIKSRQTVRFEVETCSADGQNVVLDMIKIPLFDEQGHFSSLIGVGRDITSRKNIERSLKKSEANYRYLFDFNPAIMLIYDRKSRRLLSVNQAFQHHYGYTFEEATALKLEDLMAFKKSVKNLSVKSTSGAGYRDIGEWIHRKKNGDQITIIANSHDLDYKNLDARVVVIQDITALKESQNKLKTIQDIYQQAIQNAHGIPYLWIYGKDHYDFIGQASESLMGIPPAELTVAKFRSVIKEVIVAMPNVPQDIKVVGELFRQGKIDRYIAEVKIVTPQGQIKWLHDSAVHYKDESGKIIGSLGILQDITEQKRNETIQHILYQIANAVNETSDLTELILFIRKALNEIVDTTNFFVALYDKTTDSLSLPYFVDEKDKFNHFPAGKTLTGHVIKTNQPLLLRQANIKKMIDDGIIDVVGTLSKVWLGVPIMVRGTVLGAVVVQNYINEHALTENDLDVLKFVSEQIGLSIDRKQAEVTLRTSEDRFRTIFEDSPIGLALFDTNGRFISANPEFLKILGIENQSWYNEISMFDNNIFLQGTKETLFNNQPVRLEQVINFDDWSRPHDRNGIIYLNVFITPLHTDESVVNYLVQIMDISDRKKVEMELLRNEKLESIGILAGGIAHDFNNILTAILGNITLASMFAAGQDKIKSRLSEAEKATIRARELTQRLLTFSKGGLPVKKVSNINNLIEESVKLALSGSKAKSNLQVASDLRHAEVDEGQISQVLNNIIINADQAMPEGGFIDIITANCTLPESNSSALPAGDYVKISISDHGIGISPEYLTKIFDPYFTTKKRGTGLGLTTAYSIIKNHGGKIEVSSQVGEGTTFTIYLPAAQMITQPPEKLEIVEKQSGAGRILIMDDDQIVQEVVSEMLQSLGYESDCVNDGAAALAQYQSAQQSGKPYSLVIMDLTIPGGMGGRDAIKKLLEIDPDAKVIVSSGYSNDPIMSSYQDYGFRGVAAKPYDLIELGKVLKSTLNS